jgi:type III secretion system-like peptide-binding chaperone
LETAFLSAKALIEKVIEGLGVDPAKVRAKSTGDEANWTLQRGSAAILVTAVLRKEDGGVYLRVISPIMTLPEASKREGLFRRLLELNGAGLGDAAFGVLNERVVAVSERPAAGLDAAELNHMIRHLAAVADTYDNRLVKDFGGKLASDKS